MDHSPVRRRRLLVLVGLILGCGFTVWWMGRGQFRRLISGEMPDVQTEHVSALSPSGKAIPPASLPGQPEDKPSQVTAVVVDRYAALPVVERREEPPDTQPRLRWLVTKLVRDAGSKYPLVRVQERWQQGPAGPVLMSQSAMAGDHVMVRLKPNVRLEVLLDRFKQLHPGLRRRLPASNVWIVAFEAPNLDTVPKALVALRRATDLVEHAGPDHLAHIAVTPNDAGYASLWGLHNTGQGGGTADVDVDAPEAWSLHTGSRSVLVGVLDTGIDMTHPDLVANLWTNPHEVAGNGLDDDANGYIDDVHGWDFYNNDSNAQDDHGHGTHVAGSLGAVGNNVTGVTGICWKVSIAGLKFLGSNGIGYTSDAIEAVYYATSIGAMLTSNSWSGGEYETLLETAIEDADQHGSLFVVAAGNASNNNDISARYPSSYANQNVMSVAAVNRTGALAGFSSYGLASVDIGAPGEEIYSTTLGGGYGYNSGTSMAAPQVSGVCALLKAFKPGLSHRDIKAIVLGSAQPLPSLAGKCATGGLLNARVALDVANDLAVSPGDLYFAAGQSGLSVSPGSRTYTLTNNSTGSVAWTSSTSQSWLGLAPASGTLQVGQSINVVATLLPAVNGLALGTHSATITITSTGTGRVFVRPVSVEITPQMVLNATLDTAPGWTLEGQWQYGQPLGLGGVAHGNPDPVAGVTGVNVIGINLGGDYTPAAAGPHYATAPVLDLSQYQGAVLRFQSWLNCDYTPWCKVEAQISTNGSTWTTVYTNTSDVLNSDTTWTRREVNISSLVDGHSQVRLRFGYQTTAGVYTYSGWNLDDIQVLASPVRRMALSLPVAATQEGAAPVTATLMVTPVPAANLVVSLTSSSPEQATVSVPTITVPSGQPTVTFSVAAVNDALLDGSQTVTIAASAVGYQAASMPLTVYDNEGTTLSVALPTSVTEGSSGATGTISVPVNVGRAVVVQLASNDLTEIQVPESVTIPQGSNQVTFPLTVLDDHQIDDNQTAVVTATVANWTTGQGSVVVHDNETHILAVELLPGFSEDQGTVAPAGTVRLSGTYAADVEVSFSSSDGAHLVAPPTLVIPAGETQATLQLTLVNDPAHTGQMGITVTAHATGFTDGSALTQVYDLQSVAVAATPSPSSPATQVPPDADLSWGTAVGGGTEPDSFDVYLGTTAVLGSGEKLGATTARGWPLPRLTRGVTYYWRVDSHRLADTTVGPVWQFTVAPVGGVDRFVWSGVPASTPVHSAFTATILAQDLYGDTVTSFAGTAALTTQTGAASILITEAVFDAAGAVELTNVGPVAVDVSGWQLYFYNEWSWPSPSRTVTLGTVTIPASGVMTVRGGGAAGGGYPTLYLGESIGWGPASRLGVMLRTSANEVVDFVCAGASAVQITNPVAVAASQWTGVALPPAATGGGSYLRSAGEDSQTAADWGNGASSIGVLNAGLLLPFPGTGMSLPVDPTTVTFTGGQWTGGLRVGKPHARTRLVVTDGGGHQGHSPLVEFISRGQIALLPLVTYATEGAGTINSAVAVSLPAVAASDVMLNILSADTSELASGTYTIPSGQAAVAIPLTVVNDSILDGSQVVSFQVYASGYEAATSTFTVHDNETAVLTVSAPATTTESAAGSPLQGTVSVPVATGDAVTVGLISSETGAVTVPTSVVIPAGASSASFAITVVNDSYVDGTQTAQITAKVVNWTDGFTSIQVQDNEPHTLVLSLATQMNEGAGSYQGTLTLTGLAPAPLTFNLVSSLPAQLAVPPSVTVATGQSSATFNVTPVDDTLKDGTIEVFVSASAAGFTSSGVPVLVRDNDVHTFTASTIASPRMEGVRFLWTVEARDINGLLMQAVGGPLTLSSTSSTGPVAIAPVIAGPFFSGVWNGQMRVMAPATNVRLTLSSPTASLQSNAFTVATGPRISVTPSSVSATVLQDLSVQRTVTLSNPGAGTLQWATGAATGTLLSSSGEFVAIQSTGPWPGVSPIFAAPAHPALCLQDSLSDHASLANVLASFDANATAVTSLIPARHDFTEGVTESYIINGGDNAFSYGNFLSTDRTPSSQSVPYSNGVVAARSDFGTTGKYVTRKVQGLFVLAADLDNVSWFDVAGTLGANSKGSVDGAVMRVTRQDKPYKVMVKRVFNANTPSVNHLVIVPDVSGLNHQFAQDSGHDEHRITGLQRAARLYYLVFTLKSGRYLSNEEAAVIGERFLDLAAGGTWVRSEPSSGSIAAGATQEVQVTLDSLGLPLGLSAGGLTFVSNDEVSSPSSVSAELMVNASVPTLVTEPAFTGGTANALSWDNLGAGLEYELQRDSSVSFATPVSSGWTSNTTHTFASIPEGVPQSYRVRSRVAGEAGWTSRWSALVSSTQDASGPVVTFSLPSHGYTAQPSFTAQGTATDLSGTSGLWFVPLTGAQVQAQTADQFIHWTAILPLQTLGQHEFTVAATDNATPANTTTVVWKVTRLDPTALGNGVQLAPVLAAAFNLDSGSEAAAAQAQPVLGSAQGADSKRYLTISFRRRIQTSGFTYVVETSPNLTDWTSTAGDVVELGVAPVGDGVTEICTCRISPALGEPGQKFVRVRPVLD